jgi:hypothetical protein
MAVRLPYNRVVDVSLTRQDQFAAATGFSVSLVVSTMTLPGTLDATIRTMVFGSIDEVAVYFPAGTAVYGAVAAMFQQNPRPRQVKVGYRNPANPIASEMDAIYAYDSDFYWLGHTVELRDTQMQRDLADWAEAHSVLFGGETGDTDTETPAATPDATSTVTISLASPGVITWTGHTLQAGDIVRLTTSGQLPAGLTAGVPYYVVSPATNTFSVAQTQGGSPIATTGSQSGTHTATKLLFGGSFAEYIESKNYDRSFGFYSPSATEFPALAALAYCSGRDLDRGNLRAAQRGDINSGNAYTLKFKKLIGITALNKVSAVVQAITGFVPGIGVQATAGHACNAYVNIGGLDMVVEGTVGSRAFIDEIHAGDWIVARTREELLSTMANSPRVPYTNPGVGELTNAIDRVMRRGIAAGIVAGDILEDDQGNFVPEYSITVDRVENIPASQRRNRIAPDIRVDFRYSGAFHYASSSITMRF